MPALREEMYCSQQICIPPAFPYLLRQYAKAAIRTQPPDLLRWSTAYFRCLALNLKPPVKPRLEYPIPKAHYGLTPGWLRALIHQLQNNRTVQYKVLWDRWIGACLQHENLIQMLCLGAFRDAWAIPWTRFIALCAAHLTENLTYTMILVCELLTEEPEGGSAMITLETFKDLYQFLAAIDASEAQTFRNLYFFDSMLSLYREPVKEAAKELICEVAEEEEEEIPEAEEEKEEEVAAGPAEDLTGIVISCPDIAADDFKTEEDFMLETNEAMGGDQVGLPSAEINEEGQEEEEEGLSVVEQPYEYKDESVKKDSQDSLEDEEEEEEEGEEEEEIATITDPARAVESIDTITDNIPPRQRDLELQEDLEKLKQALHDEEPEEVICEEDEKVLDEELDKLKQLLVAPPGVSVVDSETFISEELLDKKEEEEEDVEEEKDLVYVDAVPGIGPILPQDLVEAVLKYMKECAANQHGMVMPRNIRHYQCPPLEYLT